MTQEEIDKLRKQLDEADDRLLEAKQEYRRINLLLGKAVTKIEQQKWESFPYKEGDKLHYKRTYINALGFHITEEATVTVNDVSLFNGPEITINVDGHSDYLLFLDLDGKPVVHPEYNEQITLTKITE
jgi:hypothetical protein